MEGIIKLLEKIKCRYDVLGIRSKDTSLRIINNNLERVYSDDLNQYCIRAVKNGRMTTTTMDESQDPSLMADNLESIIDYGTEIEFDFPCHEISPPEPRRLDYTSETLAKKLYDPVEVLREGIPLSEISGSISQSNTKKSLINSSGFNSSYENAKIGHSYSISLKGTNDRINRRIISKDLQDFPAESLEELKILYNASKTRKTIPSGSYRVIFSPYAMWSLIWRITSGISGTNLLYKLSPLMDKLGKKVFSDLITIYEDPENIPFDDEGSPTSGKHIFEKGMFKGFIFDLYTSSKTGNKPTGNGFKSGFWSSSIDTPVAPSVSKLCFSAGNADKSDLLDQERAILIESVIGAHSGNIVQGQYSMGISLGFLIEDGKITSMVDGAMASGNIYEDFNRISAVSAQLTDLGSTLFPYILFDDISIVQ